MATRRLTKVNNCDVDYSSLTRNQRHNIERRGRRAMYDLPPDLILEIAHLAEALRLTNSMVAGVLLIYGLRDLRSGSIDLADLRVPGNSPRYDFRIDLEKLIKKWL